jgi:hypothetical protein
MATLVVKLKGAPEFIRILAANVEDDQAAGELRVKNSNGEIIARFSRKEVSGWWFEQEDIDFVERLRAARQRVHTESESFQVPALTHKQLVPESVSISSKSLLESMKWSAALNLIRCAALKSVRFFFAPMLSSSQGAGLWERVPGSV